MKKIYLSCLGLIGLILSFSCTGGSNSISSEAYTGSTAVNSFSLKIDNNIMEGLDEVFFTIDLIGGQIYNADSLPVGTDVSNLMVDVTFDYASKAIFITPEGEINYYTNPEDSLDFTKPVQLKVVSENGLSEKIYDVKVNVHKLLPDSLQWDQLSQYSFPVEKIDAQKTISVDGNTLSYVQIANDYFIYTPNTGGWNTPAESVSFGFVPDLKSLQVMNGKYFVLGADDRKLYMSENGRTMWTSVYDVLPITGLIGVLPASTLSASTLLGVVEEDGAYKHFSYNETQAVVGETVDPLFPITGYSNFITFQGGLLQQLAFFGGILADGSLSDAVWGFDGFSWGNMNNVTQEANPFTPREGALFFSYYNEPQSDRAVWFIIGGKDANGQYLKDIYYSEDMGIVWKKGGTPLTLPDDVPAKAYASVQILRETPFKAQVQWLSMDAPRINTAYKMRGIVTYANEDIPYIYVFGGEGFQNGQQITYNQVWRGVINKLSFDPIK